jgi:hypothetical protein
VDDEWIKTGAVLGGKNSGYGLLVHGVTPQTINGFGGDGHQTALSQNISSLMNIDGDGGGHKGMIGSQR